MPKYNKLRKTWRHAEEFKICAVEMSYQEGIKTRGMPRGWIYPTAVPAGCCVQKETVYRMDDVIRLSEKITA